MRSKPSETGAAEDGARTLTEPSPGHPSATRVVASSLWASKEAMRSSESGSGSVLAPTTRTITSPNQALLADEQARARVLATVGLGINALALAGFPFLDAAPFARQCFVVGLLLHVIAHVGLLWAARDPFHYRDRYLIPIWSTAMVALLIVTVFFGILSVATIALLLGLYITGRSISRRLAVVTWGLTAIGHLGLAIAFALGILPDVGILGSPGDNPFHLWISEALLQAMLLATLIIGRQSHRTMVTALAELNLAVRRVAQREAALEELRHDYRRAIKVGGPGRLTGATLGSFELGPLLGRGGMGDVYEATHVSDGTRAAVKVLSSEGAGKPNLMERFLREIEMVTQIRSEHVVRILEVGKPGDVPYIAMEYLNGQDLSAYLRERSRLPMDEVIEMVRQVGEGLAAAHRLGIVHRDIKPQNLFRVDTAQDGPPLWKVLDFGVMKVADSDGTLTRGAVVGTPSYMAPEQSVGATVDHRADLYSLGAVVYRCLVGVPAFRGRGREPMKVMLEINRAMPRRPSALAGVSSVVDDVLLVALAKAPEDRFTSAGELAEALELSRTGRMKPSVTERLQRCESKHPWRNRYVTED